MVEFLLAQPKMKKNSVNKKRMTAVDTHKRSKKDSITDGQIWQYLNDANALPAKDALKPKKDRMWLDNQRTSLMVVASLIATMAFQVGINPPGGVWQDQKSFPNADGGPHDAGTSIWSHGNKIKANNQLLISNTIGLISSLSVILLLISGLPCKRYFLPFLRFILWIAVTATTVTYLFSVNKLTPKRSRGVWNALKYSLITWLCLMTTILGGHVVRFVLKKIGWQRRQSIMKSCNRYFTRLTTTTTQITSLSNRV